VLEGRVRSALRPPFLDRVVAHVHNIGNTF
jgi:hypothetical protein